MLSYDEEKLVPLCPRCSKELKEVQVKSTNTNYYEFDYESKQYHLAHRTQIEDDNLFHCSECGAGISSKEIFETVVFLNRLKKGLLVHVE